MENVGIDLFDNDERLYINQAAEGLYVNIGAERSNPSEIDEFTRQRFMDNLTTARNIIADDAVLGLVESLLGKVSQLQDEEWNSLILQIPFPVPYCYDGENPEYGNENEIMDA